MNLKLQLRQKNNFLRKAYELAFEYSPSSPLSVSINPREFGKTLGLTEQETERIMIELIGDGHATSSLGLGMLLITNSGLNYLRQIEDEPEEANEEFAPENNDSQKESTKNIFMKQSEKLDLILRELYKYKNDGKYYSIKWICQTLSIPLDSNLELNKLAHRLKDDGYVKTIFQNNDCSAELTSYGIDYCEEDSYSYSGHSIITNNYRISVVNSPNTNFINQSNNISINQNYSAANQAVEKIREIIATDESIEKATLEDIIECLNEIEESLKVSKKPKFAIKSLIDIAGGISSISSWITVLGQFAGFIPMN